MPYHLLQLSPSDLDRAAAPGHKEDVLAGADLLAIGAGLDVNNHSLRRAGLFNRVSDRLEGGVGTSTAGVIAVWVHIHVSVA